MRSLFFGAFPPASRAVKKVLTCLIYFQTFSYSETKNSVYAGIRLTRTCPFSGWKSISTP